MGNTISIKHQLRGALAPAIVAAVLCAGFTVICGVSHSALAVTFGGMAVITLLLPPLVGASENWTGIFFTGLAALLGTSGIWLTLPISWPQWFACSALLTADVLCLSGLTASLNRLGMPQPVSAMIVIFGALAWLSWPVWLSPYLAGRDGLVNALVFAHPLLSLNGVLIDQGIWTERPMMYGWTALNQDVSYALPPSVFWCVVVNGGVGLLGVAAVEVCTTRKRKNAEHESTRMGTNSHE